MREELDIGCAPAGEECAQMGQDGYHEQARRECRALINQLRRMYGAEPEGAQLHIKRNAHDFGEYLSVVCDYDRRFERATEYALRVANGLPERWDEEARQELGLASHSTATGRGARFPLGQIVATPNALRSLTQDDIIAGLRRHINGDWGDLDEEDKRANERALREDTRLLSAYHGTGGTKFWIITEADRSVTTILLPEDY